VRVFRYRTWDFGFRVLDCRWRAQTGACPLRSAAFWLGLFHPAREATRLTCVHVKALVFRAERCVRWCPVVAGQEGTGVDKIFLDRCFADLLSRRFAALSVTERWRVCFFVAPNGERKIQRNGPAKPRMDTNSHGDET